MKNSFKNSIQLLKTPQNTVRNLYQSKSRLVTFSIILALGIIYSLLAMSVNSSDKLIDIIFNLVKYLTIGLSGSFINILIISILLLFSTKIFFRIGNIRRIFLAVVWSFVPFVLLIFPLSILFFTTTILVGYQILTIPAEILKIILDIGNIFIIVSLIVKVIYQFLMFAVAVELSIWKSILIHVISLIIGLVLGFFIASFLN